MTVAINDVLDGLWSFLTADSAFNTSLGGNASTAGRLRYGVAREADTLPYGVYNVITMDPMDAFDRDGYELLVQFSLYDVEANGPDAVVAIGDDLIARLHGAAGSTITTTGHDPITVSMTAARGPLREEETWRYDLDFRVAGTETV